ncbi:right-handed parallel beta-helix repeat-containing protein [Streptomyces sp. NPDC003077]|uniref:right-handed parallel beta-helix repeat-containing protein n=1 Tax=Streptomyces sp. NPDC003077 TaxID=3154443 RepID=UPI0033B482F3
MRNLVDDFHADPSGADDAASAFQAAVDALCGEGGGTLVIPRGHFRVHSQGIRIPDSGNLTIEAYGAHIFRSDDSTVETLMGGGYTATGYGGPSNMTIRGGRWDGGAKNSGSLDMFALCSGENIRYEDLTVENIPNWHPIEFQGVRNGTARNCVFRGFRAVDPARFFSEAIQIQEAKDGTHSVDIVVDGCSADGYGALVGTHGATVAGKFHDGVRVVNNRITNSKNYGIRAENWRNAVIANNLLQDCNSGIMVQLIKNASNPSWWWSQTENIVIANNIMSHMGLANQPGEGPRYATIGVYGQTDKPIENVIVTGNIIRDWASENGIALQNVHEGIVTGNVVKYSEGGDGTAIVFVNCSGGTAVGNNIRYAGAGITGAEVSTGNRIALP